MANPTITALPEAPQRRMARDTYPVVADKWAAALGPFTSEMNQAITWMGQQVADVNTYKGQAASSAASAAQSVTDAAAQVQLAKDQVNAATTQANNSQTYANQSKDHRDSSQAAAAAAQASAGLPAISGKADQLLSVKADASGVEYRAGPKRPTSATADQFVKVNSSGNGFETLSLPIFKDYVGNQTTLQASSALSHAHGLGVIPKIVTLELIVTGSAAGGGYAIGDVIEIGTYGGNVYNGSTNIPNGFIVTKDASTIIVRVSPNIGNLPIITKPGTGYATISSPPAWAYRVRAFA